MKRDVSENCFDPYFDACPFCLIAVRNGVPEDGKCGHEALLDEFPHLRFNAFDRHTETELRDSASRRYLCHTTAQGVENGL
jgi:hypothetical protein